MVAAHLTSAPCTGTRWHRLPPTKCLRFGEISAEAFESSTSCRQHARKSHLYGRRSLSIRAAGAVKEGELVSSEEEFFNKVTQHNGPVIVDWMAKWCRKCIYLKPKLEKLVEDEFPGLDLVFIDVNAIPGSLVYGHGIKKMPTITIHKDGTKVREHIAAEAGLKAITNIRSMINDYIDLSPDEKKQALKG